MMGCAGMIRARVLAKTKLEGFSVISGLFNLKSSS